MEKNLKLLLFHWKCPNSGNQELLTSLKPGIQVVTGCCLTADDHFITLLVASFMARPVHCRLGQVKSLFPVQIRRIRLIFEVINFFPNSSKLS